MKSTVLIATLFLLGGTVPVVAQNAPAGTAPVPAPAPRPANFAQHQQTLLTRITSQISILQQEQGCVQTAADPQALRACTSQAKAAMQALRQPH